MKVAILALAAMCCALPGVAQNAKVIELAPAEGSRAKALYEQRAHIEREIEDLTDDITAKYLRPEGRLRDGWPSSFEFSEDFRFIVPAYPRTINGWSNAMPCGSCFVGGGANLGITLENK
ncbi:hypothetical protein DYQ86_16100 [Acidobacteria bacterium AB60]|nr:hypothetical protein DYQ86_16100 [Acidobacteria bacterium AB60]